MILYILSFLIGAAGAWFLMKYGNKAGINDIPNHRSSHQKVIPKGGGIGILMVLLLSSFILPISIGFWLPVIIISLTSLWGGDKHLLSPIQRLVIQFGCSLIFLVFWVDSNSISGVNIFLCVPMSVFIVGTSNFYNFMDGIDGIAGITGIVGFSLLALYSHPAGDDGPYASLCIVLAFSCSGFLCFNLPKAKVFLGDIGSVLLGFVFSCLTIALSENAIDFFVMAGFLSIFYFDELITMAMRIRNGDSLTEPHRKHIYQLLVNELAISHWKIALLYGAIQLFVGLTTIYCGSIGLLTLMLLYVFYCILFTFISIKVREMAAAQ